MYTYKQEEQIYRIIEESLENVCTRVIEQSKRHDAQSTT